MKRLRLLALMLATACAAMIPPPDGAGRAAAASPAPGDACAGSAPLPGPEACGGAPLCAAPERVRIACELRQAMEARYVFYPVKPRLLAAAGGAPFDPRRHLDACVEAEREIAVEADALAFYDRMRRCIAAFEDGHLLLRVPGGVPQVALGLELRLVEGGKVVVAGREERLARAAADAPGAAEAAALLAPGAEVLEIDGRPVAEAVAELARHLPGSSAAARAERAVDALTRRDFAHPARAAARLVVSTGGERREIALRWWASPGAERSEIARAWLRRTGIGTTELVDWRTDPRARWSGAAPAGHVRRGDTILPPDESAALEEYAGDGGQIAARMGEVGGERPFCYAQLLTFHTETLAAAAKRRPFVAVVEELVRGCNARGLDLVLDLRQNEGGYLSHSSAIAGMLAPPGGTVPGGALLLRATAYNESVYRQRAPMLGGLPRWSSSGSSGAHGVLEAIRRARRAREDFTPAFLDAPLEANAAVGGFGGRVVALTSPSCMSACERLAGMLRSGGLATLVGGPTEGAGGSQQEAKDLVARWTDSTGRLSVSIPNAAMGIQPSGGPGDTSAAAFFEALAFENRPVEPDVEYATQAADLAHHNRGWLERARAALDAPPAPVARRPDA